MCVCVCSPVKHDLQHLTENIVFNSTKAEELLVLQLECGANIMHWVWSHHIASKDRSITTDYVDIQSVFIPSLSVVAPLSHTRLALFKLQNFKLTL